ncbi:hypothetical protein C8J57DRAFT_1363362 [Mycena rebaudengoi]|nr:hypothetical protein C8J57DRAFT_1363362 [Mycena rebaudengoi]
MRDAELHSPFLKHLNTNYIPSAADIAYIQCDLIPHSKLEELARLEFLIRDLSAQRDKLKDYIEFHQALISSPRRLPPDIVQEIFLVCLPTHRNAPSRGTDAIVPHLQLVASPCSFYAQALGLFAYCHGLCFAR